jgi:hypothetical protein
MNGVSYCLDHFTYVQKRAIRHDVSRPAIRSPGLPGGENAVPDLEERSGTAFGAVVPQHLCQCLESVAYCGRPAVR